MLRFCVENFLFLRNEKIRRGTVFCFRKFLVWKKLGDRKVGVTFYRRIFFVSLRRKTSWANPSVFEEVSSMEKIMDNEGGVTSFRRELFVPNRRKTTWMNPSVFQKRSGSKFYLDNSGMTILTIFFV